MDLLLALVQNVDIFAWIEQCEEAFQDLKKYLTSALILSCLDPEEDLYMYLVVSVHAENVVLLKDQRGIQRPIYYSVKPWLKRIPGIYHRKSSH